VIVTTVEEGSLMLLLPGALNGVIEELLEITKNKEK